MLGSSFLFTIRQPVKKPVGVVVDRLRITGRAPFPRDKTGEVVKQLSRLDTIGTGTLQRLRVTGYEQFPRLRVGGLEPNARRGAANASAGGLDGLIYGLRAVKKKPLPVFRSVASTLATGFSFTQFAGLRCYYNAAINELCLVAEADAPTGMGGVIKIDKNGTLYSVYLVETTDPDASSVRVNTTAGVKSVRLKT